MKDFYYFDSPFLPNTFQVTAIGLGCDDQGINDEENLIQSKYKGINFPVKYKQKSGKKLTDILNTGWVSLFLISEKLKKTLEENFITGWKTYPIILKDRNENMVEGYYGFSVTGISGRRSYANSPIIEVQYVKDGPIVRLYKGARVDLSKWDGSDFFIPEGSIAIVVTKKVFDLVKVNKISNLSLPNITEVEMDVEIWNKIEDKIRKKKVG